MPVITGNQFGGSGGGGGPYMTVWMLKDDGGAYSARIPGFATMQGALASNPLSTATIYPSFCVYNYNFYQCGGFDGSIDVNSLTTFNPLVLNNAWSSLANPVGRELAGFVGINNKLYYFGGTTANVTVSSTRMDIYDIVSNTWSTGTAIPIVNGNGAFAYCAYKSSIFMVAGFTQTGLLTNSSTYRYDVDSNNWVQLTNIPNANGLSYSGLVCYGDYLYLVGGKDGSSGNAVNTLYQYDILNNVWNTLAPMPVAKYGPNAALLGNTIYVLGGTTTVAVNTVHSYNIDNGKWSTESWTTLATTGNATNGGLTNIMPVGFKGV